MKKTIWKILSYLLVAFVAAGTTAIFFMANRTTNAGKLSELETLLSQCYIGEVDADKLEDAAASAMVQALGDRWSYYMTAEEYEEYKEVMNNSFVGVGITVQGREDNQGLDIVSVVEGSPAMEAGLLPGDRLTGVEDQSVLGMSSNAIAGLIRGEEGTKVKLTVDRNGETLSFTVERRKIESVVATGEMLEGNIGLVTIENFDSRCAKETIAAIEDLLDQGAQSLIFDVRNNPGGYKNELVEVLDYLLPEGEIFRSEDYLGNKEVDYSDASCLDIPMAVLVNLDSYSAAEFFAAALDYYDVATVVGEKTFGKGYFQTAIQLRDGSAVNLSIGKYYTPDGKSLAGVGLTPDVVITVDDETKAEIVLGTIDPAEDPQLQAAIEALKQ